MDITAYRKNAADMIALVRCAVNEEKPDAKLIEQLDLPALFEICQAHILTACTAYALESAGIHDAAFTEEKNKAIRKNLILDSERAKILNRLEQEKIWYMPLKGAVMKDWYPRLGMRQMSDNDILFDSSARKRVRAVMEELGFSCDEFGKGKDDSYKKLPVSNFEMHNSLFSAVHPDKLQTYYEDVTPLMQPIEGTSYGRCFGNEDFYLYVLAHTYKHYVYGGTGVRSLLDIEIILRKIGSKLDRTYLERELDKLGLTEFEEQNRLLAAKLFRDGTELSDSEKETLDYYVTSGVYGSSIHLQENRIRQQSGSRLRYIFHRIFPPMDQVKVTDPFFYRHKLLMPILWIWRPIRSWKLVFAELKQLLKKK